MKSSVLFFQTTVSLFLVGLAMAPLAHGQNADPTADSSATLWSMISQGGWAMIPLGLCSLALIYLAIHSARETNASGFGSEAFSSRVESLCRSGRIEEARIASQNEPSLLGRALAMGLQKFNPSSPEASLEKVNESIQETFDLEEHAIGQWIHYINVIATVSPMIGLLGTVSGMIGAFQTMSAGGMGRPELLAGNIGEALITTATGLCIGIPAMVAHSYFSNRLNNQLVENTQRAGAVCDSLQTQSSTID